MTPKYITLLLFALTASLQASPRAKSDSIVNRHDMQLLHDAGAINSAILTWPWPLGWGVPNSKSKIKDSKSTGAFERFDRIYALESELGFHPDEASLSLSSDKLPFRSFGSQSREQFEASISQSWLSEWFAGNISLTYADKPLDGDNIRLDGSYLAVALGNWSFAFDQVDRWWGPGWDGSLILSNNARPVPALSLTRISPDAFESRWLKWIGPWTFNTFMGQLDNDEGDRPGSNARLFGMRIDFSPFSWNNLDIGLSRTAQWAGEGRPGGWDTFRMLLLGEDNRVNEVTYENEPGNQLAGIDYRLRIPGWNVAHYFQVIGEDEETFLPDACMIMGGLETWGELSGSGATWRSYFEWADTRAGHLRRDPRADRDFNTAYNHGIYQEGYRTKGQAIGHAMDGDGVMRSIGAFIVLENGNLWGAKYRNYSLNRDGRGPHSVTINPVEGQSVEVFFELNITNSKLKIWTGRNLRIDGGLHLIHEENQVTSESDSNFGGHLSIVTSF